MSTEQRGKDLNLLDDVDNLDRTLTKWETDFVESLFKWMDDNPVLTEKQRDKLQEILEG